MRLTFLREMSVGQFRLFAEEMSVGRIILTAITRRESVGHFRDIFRQSIHRK